MYTLAEFVKTCYLIVVACTQLCKSRRAVLVVDTANLGDDKPRAALGAFFIIIHHLLGGATVKLSEAHKHRRHDYTVFNFASAYLHRRKQHFIFHNSPLRAQNALFVI